MPPLRPDDETIDMRSVDTRSLRPFGHGDRRAAILAQMSFPVRTLVLVVTAFLVASAVLVVASALVINSMKNQLVENARAEIRRQGEEASRNIAATLQGRQAQSLDEIARAPEVQAQLQVLSRSGDVVLVAMVDSAGKCVIQQRGADPLLDNKPIRRTGNRLDGALPDAEGLTWSLEVMPMPEGVKAERVPIQHQGQTMGWIEVGVAEDHLRARLDPISRMISGWLTVLVAVILAFLAVVLFLLNKIALRHVTLEREHAQAEHLASIGTLASGLAHEIRNPLHAMNLHLDAAREELEDPRPQSPEAAARIVGNVQNQIRSLNATLTNFMNYAVPGRLEKEVLPLAPLVGEVATLLAPEFAARQVSVERDVPDDAYIDADPTAVRQVLTNVLMNAAQVMEKATERRIVIRAEGREAGRWALHVDDTGPGLPPGKEQVIFDVFFSGRPGGTGFGLAIARRLMEAQGGSIAAVTRMEGGARFTMVFAAAARKAVEESGRLGLGVGGGRVELSRPGTERAP